MGALFGREQRQFAPEPVIAPVLGGFAPGAASAGAVERAFAVPTVWACVGLIANAVSSMGLNRYSRATPGALPRAMPNGWLDRPDARQTQSEWLHQVMVSALLRGNAYARVTARDGQLRPTQLTLAHPDKVHLAAQDGKTTYRFGTEPVPAQDVWHFRGLTMPGAIEGLSPVAYAAATLGLDLSARKFASDFFDAGGNPVSIVKSGQQITQAQAETIKARFLAATRDRAPMSMGDGLEFQQLTIKPEESQFLATQQANVSQIARYFLVPGEMVGGSSGDGLTYSSVEQRSLDFLTYGVAWWLRRIEDAVFPLLARPQFVRFDVTGLLRTDLKSQAEVDNMRIAGKVLAPSEVRAGMTLLPLTDEQKAELELVPLTVTPMGKAKALPNPPKPDPAAADPTP